jgi:DNA-binding NtrC family response regulator
LQPAGFCFSRKHDFRLRAVRKDHGNAASRLFFLCGAAKRFGLPSRTPTPDDINLLAGYAWPGNVRELAAVIERAALLGDGKQLEVGTAIGVASPALPVGSKPTAIAATEQSDSLLTLDAAMKRHIETALQRTRGRIEGGRGAAKALGINPHTLRARMRKLRIDWGVYRSE